MRLHYRLTVATVALLVTALSAFAQTNSVSIGTTSTNASAVLWLNGDGKQGLIIPVGTRGNVASPAKGMIIFDTNQIYVYDGANWNALSGGSGGSQTLTLSGNTISISGGNSISLATAPTASQFYMFDGTNWVAKSLSQDVANNLGVITVNGLKGKPLPASFNVGVLTSDASGNLSWTTPAGTLPTAGANQILTSNGSSAPTWASTIPGSQVTPNFGGQAISTTGTLSAAGLTVAGPTTSLNNKTYTWPNAPTLTAGSVLQTDASGNLSWAVSSLSGTAGGDLAGTYPNPTIANTAATGGNIISSINSASLTINGARINTNFNAQNILTTGTLNTGAATVSGLTIGATAINWPANASGVLTNNGTGTLSWGAGGLSSALTSGKIYVGNASNVATGVALTGDVGITNTGVTTIANTAATGGNIVSAINTSSGAINGARVTPTFGSQSISTTGTLNSGATTVSALTIGTTTINWPANTPGVLTNNGTGTLSWGSAGLSPTLNSGNIFVGNGTNVATGVPMSGDATISGTGALTIANNATTGGNIISSINSNGVSTINGARVNPSFGNQNITTSGAGAATIVGGISAGSSSQFSVNASGNITKINNLQANFPGTQGAAGSVLTNDGVGNLSWVSSSGWGLTGNASTTPGTNFIGTTDANDLVFKTNNTEWARINTSGKMGIGTTTPGVLLHLNSSSGSSGPIEMLRITSQTIGDPYIKIQSDVTDVILGSDNSSTGSGSGFVGTQNVRPFEIRTNNSDRMYFDATGSVGIGTTSPASKLDVSGDLHLAQITAPSPVTDKLYNVGGNLFWNGTNISSGGGSGWGLTGNSGTAPGTNFIGTTDPNDLVFKTNGTEWARLNTSGYFGVGTNIPGTPLHVVWNAASNINPVATIETSGAGSSAALRYRNASSQSYTMGVLGSGDFSISQLNYNVSVNDMVRISTAGNMGIKQSVPTEVLDVGGNVKFSGALMPNNSPGVAGQVLTSSGPGTPPVWKGSKSAFRVFLSGILSLTASSQTIPFSIADFDASGNFSLTNSEFVAPVKGVYTFSWKIYYQNTGSGGNYTYLNLMKNGSGILSDVYYNSGTTFPHLASTTTISLQAGDKISLATYNGAALGYVESSNAYTEFSGFLIFEN